MNWLTSLRDKVKTNEGSTKRGISAAITGCVTLYLVFKGLPVDADSILALVTSKVEFWIGVGLNVMGLLGIFIPDEPKTVNVQLPSIELVGQSLAGRVDADCGVPADRMHPTMDVSASSARSADLHSECSSALCKGSFHDSFGDK